MSSLRTPHSMSSSFMYGCSIWFIAAAPVIIFTMLAIFIGGLTAAPLGAAVGLILGVISYRYGRRTLLAAREYERQRALAGERRLLRGDAEVAMSRLTTEERESLPDKDFAWIDQHGGRHLPIENAEHARDALSRWPVTQFDSCAAQESARTKILDAAKRFDVHVSPDDKIVRNQHDQPDACH